MSSESAVLARGLGKVYHIYRNPIDRLKQMLWRGKRTFYDEYWALRDVELEVTRGQTFGIIGRNGSGKSTLLQLICGTVTPTCGELFVEGRVAALLELGSGFNPEFTGRENVYLAASVLGLGEDQIRDRYQSITEFAAIGDFIDQPVKIYSSGMYARLAFAVAAHVNADILIIDEILSVGDAAFTQKCMRFIQAFKKQGTILFVSHDTGAVMNLCDQVLWVDAGMVREIGVPKEVCHRYHAALVGEKDNAGTFKIGGTRKSAQELLALQRDHRQDLLRESNMKNIVETFTFDPDAPWFGHRRATITNVELLNDGDPDTTTLLGGELVELRIETEVLEELTHPIVGFYVKDRLGQLLFGDNSFLTYREHNVSMPAGEHLAAVFRFQLPFLPTGDYSITVAISNGTQQDHTNEHWIDDALFFKVHSSHIHRGLIGVPMVNIELKKIEALARVSAG